MNIPHSALKSFVCFKMGKELEVQICGFENQAVI